jgi:CheY-like chemotaxis protein
VDRVKILVMDDDKDIRITACRILERMGCEVEPAGDGAEAIKLYKQARDSKNPFGIVIMDLAVPNGMGGKEAVKELIEIDPAAKVIVSSGNLDDSAMTDPGKYGFKTALAKPYTIEELSEALRKAAI